LTSLIRLAWRNVWRQRRRSLVTSSAMAIGIALCMSIIAFQDGFNVEMKRVMIDQRLGHIQLHHPDYPGRGAMHDALSKLEARLGALEGQPEILALTARLKGPALIGGPKKAEGGLLKGVDPTREEKVTQVNGMVVDGRYLSAQPKQEIVLGFKLARKIEVGLGDDVVILTQAADGSMGNTLLKVVGLISTGDEQTDKLGAHTHLADLQELLVMEDQAHEITLVTRRGTDLDQLAENLRSSRGGEAALVRTWQEIDPQTFEMMKMQEEMGGVVLFIILGVAGIVILNTMMMTVFERTRELGVLKALGMRPRRVVGLITAEAAGLSTLSVIIGLTLGGLLDWVLVTHGVKFMEGDLTFNGVRFSGRLMGVVRVEPIIQAVVMTYIISILAALWPALRAARLDPVESMRQE
jgi:ABC-type lipoprotein release transport system permease subunit